MAKNHNFTHIDIFQDFNGLEKLFELGPFDCICFDNDLAESFSVLKKFSKNFLKKSYQTPQSALGNSCDSGSTGHVVHKGQLAKESGVFVLADFIVLNQNVIGAARKMLEN